MRRFAAAALAFAALATLGQTAPRRTRKKPAPAPAVSTAERQEAAAYVTGRAARALDTIENAAALVPFFAQVSSASSRGPLHILHYGDSHTASDDWAHAMRQALQSKFGNGGPGYTLAGYPFRGYRRFDISGASSTGWQTEGTIGHAGDGRYGLAGVSIATASPGETVSLTTDCATLRLLYLRQPGGGRLEFSVDGVPLGMVSTSGEPGPGSFDYAPRPGRHEYLLRTQDKAPVKLFGWTADNASGITYETLGINGARSAIQLDWDEAILADHMAQRTPALIVVAYGTNDAVYPRWTAQDYAGEISRVLQRLRRNAPLASILVVGPPDFEVRLPSGQYYSGHLSEVVDITREIALQQGCAFWDWRARMGGAGSVAVWAKAGYGAPDHVHLSSQGYRLIGEMLADELMEQYRRFQSAVKTE